jgi:carbon-monoxide dehydrogenase medium subunit
MKPVDFDYAAPEEIEEVLALLGTWGAKAKILAGGQSLIPLLVARNVRPEFVIDINRLRGLDFIEERNGGIAIGATVRQSDAEQSPLVRTHGPLLKEALFWVGVPQVRNLGTVVGSLAQRNAISEIPTVAVATGAQVTLLAPDATRRVVEAETFLDPDHPLTLAPHELVTEVWFPKQQPGSVWGFVEAQKRQAHYALVGIAVTFGFDADGQIADPRMAASGISSRPVRLRSVETALLGKRPHADLFAEASRRALTDPAMQAFSDVHASAAYRAEVTPVLIERALAQAVARPGLNN